MIVTLIGGVFGLVGVFVGFVLSRRASEGDRKTEQQFKIYQRVEALMNLLIAFQKQRINLEQLHPKWARTTEEVLEALIRSGLNKAEKKRVFQAINGKWEDPESVTRLRHLADNLLKKLDPDFLRAGIELLSERGQKAEDIEPIILPKG